MTTPFVRTRIATAVAGLALALGTGQALATGFQLNEQSASSLGNAFAAGAAFTDDVTAMWWNPAALSKFSRPQVGGVFNVITPSIKFQNDGSLPAAQPAARRHRRRRGRLQLCAEPLCFGSDQRAVDVRSRGQRAVRTDDRVRRRLARSLPGAEIGDQDAQRQPGPVLAGDPDAGDRRRRQLPAHRRDADAKRQLFGGAAHGRCRSALQHRPRIPDLQRDRGPDRRARFQADDHRRRRCLGLERRPRVGCHPRVTPGCELPLGDQVQHFRAMPILRIPR